jgi:TonB family protein
MRKILALIAIAAIGSIHAIAQQQAKQDGINIPAMIEAAEQGDVNAQIKLGDAYVSGANVAKDYEEAVKWFSKAAEQGNIFAQIQLTSICSVFQKDYVKAYMWIEVATDSISHAKQAGQNYPISIVEGTRQRISPKMTPTQIAEARRWAGEWKSKHPNFFSKTQTVPKKTAPVPLIQPNPPYTEKARIAGVEGSVLVTCIVRKDGLVDSCKVIRGLGLGLDESAVNTIAAKWRFKPATLDGVAVNDQIGIWVSFNLQKEHGAKP